jgi:hypothetical protein
MENNRRSFFKGLAAFASGVVAAKVASYTPKKEEPKKEEPMVTSYITITHEGQDYHPLVVKKTDADKMLTEQPNNQFGLIGYKLTIRKADI